MEKQKKMSDDGQYKKNYRRVLEMYGGNLLFTIDSNYNSQIILYQTVVAAPSSTNPHQRVTSVLTMVVDIYDPNLLCSPLDRSTALYKMLAPILTEKEYKGAYKYEMRLPIMEKRVVRFCYNDGKLETSTTIDKSLHQLQRVRVCFSVFPLLQSILVHGRNTKDGTAITESLDPLPSLTNLF
jgi:hypothetical protein